MNLFTPAEYTANYASVSVRKAKLPLSKLLLLGILSGFLIGFPSLVTNIAVCAIDNGSVVRIMSGVLFAFGLGMVVLTGAELFTGNCLMIIGVLDRRITAAGLLRNWSVVLLGNFLGSMLLSWIAARFGWLSAGHGALAAAYPLLTWGNYLLGNLIPVTLGNTVGGCAVGALFWFCWLRQPKEK